jgi:hypothetical protein
MPKPTRLTGLPTGEVDPDNQDVVFHLAEAGGRETPFVARYGVAVQIIAALGVLTRTLYEHLAARKAATPVQAIDLSGAHIQKDRWSDHVLVQMEGADGTRTLYKIPCRTAAEIADRLKTESDAPTRAGHA